MLYITIYMKINEKTSGVIKNKKNAVYQAKQHFDLLKVGCDMEKIKQNVSDMMLTKQNNMIYNKNMEEKGAIL